MAGPVAPIDGMECEEGATPEGDPITVGGSLSLTGAFAPTAAIHNTVAEIVVDWVNACGGIDDRPLEWTVLDDQSTPAQAASNYERLLNEGVDLVMGPYGAAQTLAAAAPIGRAGYALFTHTNGSPEKLIGDFHFPSWQFGDGTDDPEELWIPAGQTVVDAVLSADSPPESVYYVTGKIPANLNFVAAAKTAFEAAGVETVGDVQYELGTTDFSSIALRIAAEQPDLVVHGAVGLEVTNLYDAFAAAGYAPPAVFASFPAPAALAALGSEADGILTSSLYENESKLAETDIARYFSTLFTAAAQEAGLFPEIETQAATSFAAWQILLTGLKAVGPDNAGIIEYLNETEVDTIAGPVSFDGYNNYGSESNRVTQIQDGVRVLVWPEDVAGGAIQLDR